MRAAADGCRHGRAVALPGSVTAHWLGAERWARDQLQTTAAR